MRKLDARDCHRCGRGELEPKHRRTSPLDRSVILFDDAVEVLAGSNTHAPPRRMLSSKQPEGAMARLMAIEGHLSRRTVRMRGEGLPEERLGGGDAAVLAQEEVDATALLPLALDRDLGLVNAPGRLFLAR
jgi:hypothetical protein